MYMTPLEHRLHLAELERAARWRRLRVARPWRSGAAKQAAGAAAVRASALGRR